MEPKTPEANKSVEPLACPWINVSCLMHGPCHCSHGPLSMWAVAHAIRRLRRGQRGTVDRPAAADGDEILSSESLLPRWQARVAAAVE